VASACAESEEFIEVGRKPFLLTMLYQIRIRQGSLQKIRGELFDRIIRSLLSREGLLAQDAQTG